MRLHEYVLIQALIQFSSVKQIFKLRFTEAEVHGVVFIKSKRVLLILLPIRFTKRVNILLDELLCND